MKILEKMDKIKKNMGIAKPLTEKSHRTEFNGRIQHRMEAYYIIFIESPTLLV